MVVMVLMIQLFITQVTTSGFTAGPLMKIMDESTPNGFVNLVLSDTGITSAGIDKLVNGGFISGNFYERYKTK